MPTNTLTVITQGLSGDGPLDTAASRCILNAVNRGDMGETLEVATPHRVLAFGKHDTSASGFDQAVSAAKRRGFQPTVRIAGGRAAVFHEHTVRFGWTLPVEDPASSMHARFEVLAQAVVDALSALGIEAAIGEVPGEYCPGRYSVHISGRKIMGVGQRLTKNAAYVGGVIVLGGAQLINHVLGPVYDHLGLPFDPVATGALSDVCHVLKEDLMEVFVEQIAGTRKIVESAVPDTVQLAAQATRTEHDPTILAGPA